MATRLQKAVEEFKRAIGDRPFVLLYDPTQTDDKYAFHMSIPTRRPYYIPLGMLHQGIANLHRIIQATETSAGVHRRAPEFQRDDSRTLDMIGLAIDFQGAYQEVLLAVIEKWTDEQCAEAERWAGAEHLGASDNPDVRRLPRPTFFPETWR